MARAMRWKKVSGPAWMYTQPSLARYASAGADVRSALPASSGSSPVAAATGITGPSSVSALSSIATSTSWPTPVCSRCCSAASAPMVAIRAATVSTM